VALVLAELVGAFGPMLAGLAGACHRFPFRSFFGYFIKLPFLA